MTIRALWTDFGGVLTEPVAKSTQRFCAQIGVPVPAYQAAMRAVAGEVGATDTMAPLDVPLISQHTWERRMERALAVAGFDVDLSDFPARWFTGRPINDRHLGRLRELYAELYADTGGVPAPDTATDGTYINYPDIDLTNPELNTSGIPWQTLYYKHSYPRLREIKARWDPTSTFTHPLAIR